MRNIRSPFGVVLLLLTLGDTAVLAQAEPDPAAVNPTPSHPTSGEDRLFLGFAEEATVVDRQWWEGQIELSEADVVDMTLLRGIVAFQPWKGVEIGGRVGFGRSDTAAGLPDGSGATDLDVWGKLHLGERFKDTAVAVGGIATVPTGDDTAGLGTDAFSFAGFASVRHRLTRMTISGNVGARVNGDGQILGGQDLDGTTSLFLGGGLLVPLSGELSLVAEARIESERFEDTDEDGRVLGGINWRLFEGGTLRGAVAAGLTDGAPDFQILAGYAAQF
jgi:hypothetical protein